MPVRRLVAIVSPVLAAVDWSFSAAMPCFDVGFGGVAAWWFGMQVLRPDVFDHGSFTGLQWAPDADWIAFGGLIVLLHLAGLLNAGFFKLRMAACLLSGWYWLCVAFSLTRSQLVPGTGTYGMLGASALVCAVYLSGRAPRDA